MKAFWFLVLLPHLCIAQDSLRTEVARDTIIQATTVNEPKKDLMKMDTIWVPNPSRNSIMFMSENFWVETVDIGHKDIRANITGECRCTVVFKSMIKDATPTSIYIRYKEDGIDKLYGGTIAYKDNMSVQEAMMDVRKKNLPQAINAARAITVDAPSVEKQLIERRIAFLAGKEKDRISTIGDVDSKLIFKLGDIMQDDDNLYFKFSLINESKVDYKIELIDFLYKNTANEKDYKRIDEDRKVSNGVAVVSQKSKRNIIYSIPKINITSKWELIITLHEKDGTRKKEISVPFDKINSAPSKFEN